MDLIVTRVIVHMMRKVRFCDVGFNPNLFISLVADIDLGGCLAIRFGIDDQKVVTRMAVRQIFGKLFNL